MDTSQHNGFTFEVGSKHITVADSTVRNAPQAAKADTGATYLSIMGCMFEDITLSTAFNCQNAQHVRVVGTVLQDSAGGMTLGEGSVVTGCRLQNITGAGIQLYGRGTVSASNLSQVTGVGIEAKAGGVITGNVLDGCGSSTAGYGILVGASSLPSASTVTGNTITNPQNTGHATGTGIGLWGANITATGNVIHAAGAALPRGIRAVTNSSKYVITGNVITGATTAVLDDNAGATKYVANNI